MMDALWAAQLCGSYDIYRDPEICICAALRCLDGTVILGHRHPDCFHNLAQRPVEYRPTIDHTAPHQRQGFWTNRRRFVTRYAAANWTRATDEKSAQSGRRFRDYPPGGIITSEDFY